MSTVDETGALAVEFADAIAIIRINQPQRRNALSTATLTKLNSVFSEITAASGVSAIVFTGTGDAFSSGADIRELATLNPQSARSFAERGQKLFQRIANARQRTVAAINGYCMGGGLDLALACDVRVASQDAVFSHPGAQLGIITGWGGTQRLPRLIGKARALELFLTARRFSAQEALEIGLITHIDDAVLDFALKLARNMKKEIADCPAISSYFSN